MYSNPSTSMDFPSFEMLFHKIKQNLWAIGTPYGDKTIKFRYSVITISLWIMISSEACYFISKMSAENFLEMAHLTPCICIGLLSLLKIMELTRKRENIFLLTEQLKDLYNEVEADSEKRDLLGKTVVFLIRFIKYFLILNWILITVYCFAPLIPMFVNYWQYNKVEFLLPYAVLLPFEVDSWTSWVAVFIYSTFCGYSCTLLFTTSDVLYFVLTSQVCGNFKVLSQEFQKLDQGDFQQLQKIVKDHQYILKLSEDLENIFGLPNLFNVLIGSIEICALGFNLTSGDLKQMPGYILFLSSVLVQILMMSVFGENIITESMNICQAAYESNWYKMDKKWKKTILTIIIRSGKAQKLTAYKFTVIGYASFGTIISTSWSYFTILKTVYTPPDCLEI